MVGRTRVLMRPAKSDPQRGCSDQARLRTSQFSIRDVIKAGRMLDGRMARMAKLRFSDLDYCGSDPDPKG